MFLLFRKKTSVDKLYPSFIARMFAAVLDLGILAMLLVPLSSLISHIVYNGEPPSEQLQSIMLRIFNQVDSFTTASNNLINDPEYREFEASGGYYAVLVERAIQMLLLSAVILAFWIKTSSTPGKMLLSLKIVDDKTLQDPSVVQLIIRLLSYVVSALPLGFGFLYTMMNKKGRAWHDLIAGTVVISKKHLPR